jgi:hypothetical protein
MLHFKLHIHKFLQKKYRIVCSNLKPRLHLGCKASKNEIIKSKPWSPIIFVPHINFVQLWPKLIYRIVSSIRRRSRFSHRSRSTTSPPSCSRALGLSSRSWSTPAAGRNRCEQIKKKKQSQSIKWAIP